MSPEIQEMQTHTMVRGHFSSTSRAEAAQSPAHHTRAQRAHPKSPDWEHPDDRPLTSREQEWSLHTTERPAVLLAATVRRPSDHAHKGSQVPASAHCRPLMCEMPREEAYRDRGRFVHSGRGPAYRSLGRCFGVMEIPKTGLW